MNYKIITDPDKLKEFIDWLPELQNGEGYYVCLFGRSKYNTTEIKLSAEKTQIKRFTSSKEYLYDKIKQLECEVGSYKQKHQGIPQEVLALYITPNPRSYQKAAKQSCKALLDLVLNDYNGYNPHQEVMSQIQGACSRKIYIDFDFDGVSLDETKEKIFEIINPDCLTFVETRGGFHVLIEVSKIKQEFVKTWYMNITKIDGVDCRGDNLIPCPGTFQGGFCPILHKN